MTHYASGLRHARPILSKGLKHAAYQCESRGRLITEIHMLSTREEVAMKKVATVALVPLFAGFLWAAGGQATQTTQTTTTKTTYNGTLVDAGCMNKHTENKETTTTTTPDSTSTVTRTETSNRVV